jgi:hypothetical protein
VCGNVTRAGETARGAYGVSVLGSTASGVVGWAFLGVVLAIHRRVSGRVPDIVEAILLLGLGSLAFGAGGWMFWWVYRLGRRGLSVCRGPFTRYADG